MKHSQTLRAEVLFFLILPAMARHRRRIAYAGFMLWARLWYPKHEGVQLERARKCLQRGHYRRANAIVRRLCDLPDATAQCHAMQYLVLLKLEDRNGAMEAIHRAVALDPESAEFLVWTGRQLYHEGRHEDAEKAFREALDVESHHSYARVHLACLLKKMGRLEEESWLKKQALQEVMVDHDRFLARANAYIMICALRGSAERVRAFVRYHPKGKSFAYLSSHIMDEIDRHKKLMD